MFLFKLYTNLMTWNTYIKKTVNLNYVLKKLKTIKNN